MLLLGVIIFLVWERTTQQVYTPIVEAPKPAPVKKPVKKVVAVKKVKPKPQAVIAKAEAEEDYNDLVISDDAVDVEEIDDTPVVPLKKKTEVAVEDNVVMKKLS